MKKFKSTLLIVVAMLLVAVISVTATIAYLKSQTEVVTNTFTVGNVKITLDETDVDEYGEEIPGATRVKANEYKLIPGREYIKDPTVHVDGASEDAYLFVKVVIANGFEDLLDTETISAQMENWGWTSVGSIADVDTAGVYYYSGSTKNGDSPNATGVPVTKGKNYVVFESFKLKSFKADETEVTYADIEPFKDQTITIQAYAIQSDGFTSAKQAYTASPCSWGPTT